MKYINKYLAIDFTYGDNDEGIRHTIKDKQSFINTSIYKYIENGNNDSDSVII